MNGQLRYTATQSLATDDATARFSVAVIGAGTMGIGIAQVAAAAGHPVLLFDINGESLHQSLQGLRARLNKRVAQGKANAAHTEQLLQRIRGVETLEALRSASLIIEAVAEILEIKQNIFTSLEALCPPDTLFASNTSSLSVTAIACGLRHPQRLAGMHFFNPAPVMKLVEIVRGRETSDSTVARLSALAQTWGKRPVICQSTPGFIVNRIARPFYTETLKALEIQLASPATLDAVIRDVGGFVMGALELTDLIGQDVNYRVTESLFRAFGYDPRFQSVLVQQSLVEAGHLGRKTGRGFYHYRPPVTPPAIPWAIDCQAHQAGQIHINGQWEFLTGFSHLLATRHSPVSTDGECLILLDDVRLLFGGGQLSSELAACWQTPVVQFDLCADYSTSPAIALYPAAQNSEAHTRKAIAFFQALGKRVIVLPDHPGMLVLRTVAMLCNEALEVVHKGIASADDVDQALCLGVNYPRGPLSWGRQLGWQRLLDVLQQLEQFYGDGRYRPAPLLRQLAAGYSVTFAGLA